MSAGTHRMGWREQHLRDRADRMARHDVPVGVRVSLWCAAVADWLRVAGSNLRDAVTPAADPRSMAQRRGWPR